MTFPQPAAWARPLTDRLWTRRSLQGRSLMLVAALSLLVLTAAGWLLAALGSQSDALEKASADREVLSVEVRLDSSLRYQDTAIRAYFVTGEVTFLDSFDATAPAVAAGAARLAGSTEPSIKRNGALVASGVRAWEHSIADQRRLIILGTVAPGDLAASSAGVTVEDVLSLLARLEIATAAEADQHTAVAAQNQQAVAVATVLGSALGLCGLGLVAWAFTGSTLRPIRRLAESARSLAAGEEIDIPTIGGAVELSDLSRALAAWQQTARERLSFAQAMVELGTAIDLERVIESGSRRLMGFLEGVATVVTITSGPAPIQRMIAPGLPADGNTWPMPASSPTARAALYRRTVVTDLRTDIWDPYVTHLAASIGVGPAIALPMLSAGKLIGVLVVCRAIGTPMFSPADVQNAELLLQPLAVAVHVATLFSDVREANVGLELASRHKSEFLATMSHELRTPLNSILGFSQLLESSDFGALNERQRRYVGHIQSSGAHLLTLINDVLDLSKVEAGQLELDTASVSLSESVEQCLAKVRPMAGTKQLELVAEGLDGVYVQADSRRLQQILLNLLSNAIKFTPTGGRICVGAASGKAETQISVTDTGIGIAKADLERIFDQFIQVGSGRTRNQQGTGLGLALSRRLARLMGGEVRVESQPDEGSVFTIRLPTGVRPARRVAVSA